jgi:hypothetical protein
MDDLSLHGWDDGKIYYYESGKGDRCVNDEPELFELLIKNCKEYYGKKDEISPGQQRSC